jgi:IS30 family transposase
MISRKTIYRLVAQKYWPELLPRKGKRYRQRKGVEAGARLISNWIDIEERVDHVDFKEKTGHWEGDTVYGQDRYLVTLVERVSKLLLAARVKKNKAVTRVIKKILTPFKNMRAQHSVASEAKTRQKQVKKRSLRV